MGGCAGPSGCVSAAPNGQPSVEAEDRFVFSLIQEDERFFREEHGPWIGGIQVNANREPDGNWRWVTGERFVYTNWQSGEPNNSGGGDPMLSPGTPVGQTEELLHYKREFSDGESVPVWNDLYHQYLLSGYIAETDDRKCSNVHGASGASVRTVWPSGARGLPFH
jgi:hypothetical protein